MVTFFDYGRYNCLMVTGIFTRSSTQSTIKSALFIAIFGLLRAQLTLAGYVKQCGRRTHIAPLAPPPLSGWEKSSVP